MKNFSLIVFISCLICLSSFSLSKKSFRSSSKIQTKVKAKTKSNTSQVCLLSVSRHAFLTSLKIAAKDKGANNIWICAPNGANNVKFFKFGGLSAAIKGTAPTSCDMMAANINTELYVVSAKKLYFLSKNLDLNSYTWNEVSGATNVVDVTVDNNNLAYYINTAGAIFKVNGLVAGTKYSDTVYGADCRFEAKYASEDGFYLIKNDKKLYNIDNKGAATLISDFGADDLCTDLAAGLYLAAYDGIYLMKSSVKAPVRVTTDLATSISCSNAIWFIGADGYVYQGTRR